MITRILSTQYPLCCAGKLAELRLLVIPGQADYAAHIDSLAAFTLLAGRGSVRLECLHAHGVYGEAKSPPRDAARGGTWLADGLRARGVAKLSILPVALYL
ncbi:hypothetical protein KCP76_13255 [Salmonella enterica subsp. enterica serovar Weltevreden]|nr:hypothetical protein KCP76_13255 [Salmonella enterica subsp. enterica serovar Weltevreden]